MYLTRHRLDAEEFIPKLDHFTQSYRHFDIESEVKNFLSHQRSLKRNLWKSADAADFFDASRLKFSTLRFMAENLRQMISLKIGRNSIICDVREFLGLPRSMKGAFRKVYEMALKGGDL